MSKTGSFGKFCKQVMHCSGGFTQSKECLNTTTRPMIGIDLGIQYYCMPRSIPIIIHIQVST